jgi:hypothetical protein
VASARQTFQVVGIVAAAAGVTSLPFPRTSPRALSQSLVARLAEMGAFTRFGLGLLAVGLSCLGIAALLPRDD